jgi:putative Mg2+ transporter-C (MgtC) family protein
MMPDLKEIILRIVLATLLSGLIGLERELRHRGAGLRTHILVCLGSTLIMLTSLYVFDIYKDVARAQVDPGRIAAGIVTGIGFLCAGTIIRYGRSVKGLTTAASLWVTSGLGMAIGVGFYAASVTVAVVMCLVLVALRPFEKKLGKGEE